MLSPGSPGGPSPASQGILWMLFPFSEHPWRKSGLQVPLHQVAPISGLVPTPSSAAPLTAALSLPDLSSPNPPKTRGRGGGARPGPGRTQRPEDQTNDKRHPHISLAAPRRAWPELGSPRVPVRRGQAVPAPASRAVRTPAPPGSSSGAAGPAQRPKPGPKRHLALAARHFPIVRPGTGARPPVGGQFTGVKGAGGGPGSRDHKTRTT